MHDLGLGSLCVLRGLLRTLGFGFRVAANLVTRVWIIVRVVKLIATVWKVAGIVKLGFRVKDLRVWRVE